MAVPQEEISITGETAEQPAAKASVADGVQLARLNRGILVTAILLIALAVVLSLAVSNEYHAMQETTETYISTQQDAGALQSGSDYLTEQVRLFVVAENEDGLRNYFRETEEVRSRDLAVENLSSFAAGSEAEAHLQKALKISNELMQTEYYAMRLAIESRGASVSRYPQVLQDTALSSADLALDAVRQREKAFDLVLGDAYRARKDEIREEVRLSTEALVDLARSRQQESSRKLGLLLNLHIALLAALAALIILVVVLNARLIILPIKRAIGLIRSNRPIPERGASELHFLAQAYNQSRAQNLRQRQQLDYEASHDALTGLYNRSVFEKHRRSLDKLSTLILIDLDRLKEINDNSGHETGDRALQKTAKQLAANFRESDWICRIGGDEFAVIMLEAGKEERELIRERIERINEALRHPEEDLPALSVSAGVAFGDRIDPGDDIFKDADRALYRAKEDGRSRCVFHGEDVAEAAR